MSGKNKHQERIDEFFKLYKDEDTCLVASDGQIFQKKAAVWAKRHAESNGLKIEEATRPSSKTPKSNEGGSDKTSTSTEKPVSKWNKTELEDFAKEHKIELKGKNNEEKRQEVKDFLNTNFDPDKVEDAEGSEDTEENTDGEFTPTETTEK